MSDFFDFMMSFNFDDYIVRYFLYGYDFSNDIKVLKKEGLI